MSGEEVIKLRRNPVIAGFHPDPSICRVGEDYYLVTSSFEYFPGVPVFNSRDLVNWRQIGHCLTRKSQLNLDHVPCSRGIYAPVIRYYRGRFFMITTHVTGGGHFLVHSTNPAGAWSEPVWIDCDGIDPSLFFDEKNGCAYFQCTVGSQDGTIVQSEIDINTGALKEVKPLWKGTGGQYAEAPHIYFRNGWYYLMVAEGGTEYGHMVTIARSRSIWGPFVSAPANPILTHRSTASPVQATGHADMVQAQDGSWWMVCLGIRPVWGRYHNLGRETFLAPVQWDDDDWPVVGTHGMLPLEVSGLQKQSVVAQTDTRDDFESESLSFCWNFVRNPIPGSWSLSERSGFLRLYGQKDGLDSEASPAFVGRRQTAWRSRVRVAMAFDPQQEGQRAGLTVFKDRNHHYDMFIERNARRMVAKIRQRIGPLVQITGQKTVNTGNVFFRVESDETQYRLFIETTDGERLQGIGDAQYLSTEVTGGFTGVYFAMFAENDTERDVAPADFDWFEQENTDEHNG